MNDFSHAWLYMQKVMHDFSYALLFAMYDVGHNVITGLARR